MISYPVPMLRIQNAFNLLITNLLFIWESKQAQPFTRHKKLSRRNNLFRSKQPNRILRPTLRFVPNILYNPRLIPVFRSIRFVLSNLYRISKLSLILYLGFRISFQFCISVSQPFLFFFFHFSFSSVYISHFNFYSLKIFGLIPE